MENLTIVALAKAAKELAENVTLDPGSYNIDQTLTLSLKGTLAKQNDTQYTPTVSIPLKAALTLHLAGFTREKAKAILVQVMLQSIQDHQPPTLQPFLQDVEEAMKHVQQVINTLPKQIRKGATTAKLIMQEI